MFRERDFIMYTPILAELARRLSVALTFLVMTGVTLSAAFAQPVRIAVGAASVASLPTWVAQDGGYFAREGIQSELIYIRGGPQTLSALVGGDVPFAQVYSQPVLAARLTGADTVIVAGLINTPLFSIITVKEIGKPEELRGKKIGISTFGSATDLAAQF